MKPTKNNRPFGKPLTKAQQVAAGGIFSSLALVAMLLGGLLPIATFTAPVFAGIMLLPVAVEVSTKFALLAYLAVSLLSTFLLPDKEMALFFVFIFGYYPILHPYLQRIRNKLLRIFAKLSLFNCALALIYGSLYLLLGPVFFQQQNFSSLWLVAGFWLLGNFVFIMYDTLIVRVKLVYFCYLRRHIFH